MRFCDKFVNPRSRTHDQMVQGARSGAQNLQEGSVDSAVSKKIEMKLTGIARGSLQELQRDYQKFLKHRSLPEWPPNHPALTRFKARRCATIEQFRQWVAEEVRLTKGQSAPEMKTRTDTDRHGRPMETRSLSVQVRVCPCSSASVSSEALPAVLAANGALSLLNLCIHLIGRQIGAQATTFEKDGGFTERLYRRRTERRNRRSD